jgi:UDP-N-acetylmuramyl pentapeptide phosphotransferase/UDP-N-acetylglucosamine-1-phosphate transferase
MFEFLFFIFSFLLLFLINNILLKNNFLVENKSIVIFPHKKFSLDNNSVIPVSGGVFFCFFLFLIIKININLFYYLLTIFIIGLLSDLKFLKSPFYRIILQLMATIIFFYFNQQFNIQTRIVFIDNLLNSNAFQIIFVTFCALILINGFNFIDGVNLLASLNFLIISIFLNIIFIEYNTVHDNYLIYLSILIFTFCIYNFYGKSFLGDGGVYLLSALLAERVIFISSFNTEISPYYIINILWYPAFENLFSIVRRIISNKSADSPDNFHLHHYLLAYVKKRKLFSKSYIESSFTGIVINLFILFIMILATLKIHNTKYQLAILFINIISYLFLYSYLKSNFSKKKNYFDLL